MLELDKDDDVAAWKYADNTEYTHIKWRYRDRPAIGEEFAAKRKSFEKMSTDDPFYHRAAVSVEMAQMRYDMSYIVAMNNKMQEYINTISFLHDQVGVLQGAYAHIKLLAEKARIDYAISESTMKAIDAGLKMITKIKEDLQNGTK